MRYLGFKILHFKWKNRNRWASAGVKPFCARARGSVKVEVRSPEATDWKNGSTNDLSAPLAGDRSASVSQRVLGSFLRSMLRGPEPGSAPPAALTTRRAGSRSVCARVCLHTRPESGPEPWTRCPSIGAGSFAGNDTPWRGDRQVGNFDPRASVPS